MYSHTSKNCILDKMYKIYNTCLKLQLNLYNIDVRQTELTVTCFFIGISFIVYNWVYTQNVPTLLMLMINLQPDNNLHLRQWNLVFCVQIIHIGVNEIVLDWCCILYSIALIYKSSIYAISNIFMYSLFVLALYNILYFLNISTCALIATYLECFYLVHYALRYMSIRSLITINKEWQ